jgi:hypothetical protein
MWPLSIFLFLGTALAPHSPLGLSHDFPQLKLPVMQHRQLDGRELTEERRRNTCYTMRSYFFRRQDGQAPVPAGMITCTPADILQNRQVSPRPRVRFVPLAIENDAQ